MKSSPFHIFVCLALLSITGSSLTGCGKIKTLIARRPVQPSPTPATGPAASVTDGTTPSPGLGQAGATVLAATPAHPAAPAINKSAAVIVIC